jgi:hypothetical protein
MSVPDSEAAAELPGELPDLPYAITPHIAVKRIDDGGFEFVFGRSVHPGIAMTLRVGGLAGAVGTLLLWLSGASATLVTLVASLAALVVVFTLAAVHRRTRVISKEGALWFRTEYLPLLGYERTLPRSEIRAIRRHMSLRLFGNSVYQIRAHLRSGEIVPTGHGITDKVEAASIANAMERALGG